MSTTTLQQVAVEERNSIVLPPALTFERWLCGGFGGLARVGIGYPFDQVKIKMQMNRNADLTVGKCVKHMWHHEGKAMAFFHGSGLSFATSTIQMSLNFGFKSFTERELAKNDILTNHTALRAGVAGMVGGFFHALSVSPVDYLRIQQLVHNNMPLYPTFKHVMKYQGVKGLFKGVTPTIMRDAPGLGLYFATYKASMEALAKARNGNTTKDMTYYAGCLAAGGLSGVAWWSLPYPFDLVKTLMQKDVATPPKYPTIRAAMTHIYRDNGIKGFVRGLDVCLARAVVVNAGVFLTVELTHKALFE